MDATVHDNNPYSRLMALKTMQVVPNYEEITNKSLMIVGVGGVGSVVAEMLTRCGIGKLILIDYDKVTLANMNRLFYQPKHVNQPKVEAARSILNEINSDVQIDAINMDITTLDGYDRFESLLTSKEFPLDLILCCVDNYNARLTVNKACNELGQIWLEAGVSENAVSGHIQYVEPGATACFECLPPLSVSEHADERLLKRGNVCAASLPTTMGLISALLGQHALKIMLKFGEIKPYICYNALKDQFNSDQILLPNKNCGDEQCRMRQNEYREGIRDRRKLNFIIELSEQAVKHESNEYSIELIEENVEA